MASKYPSRGRRTSLGLLPSGLCCESRNVRSVGWGKALCASFAPFQSTLTLRRGMTFGFTNHIVGIARSNVYDQFGEFVGITRTLGHEPSMPQAAPLSSLKSKLRHYPALVALVPCRALAYYCSGKSCKSFVCATCRLPQGARAPKTRAKHAVHSPARLGVVRQPIKG